MIATTRPHSMRSRRQNRRPASRRVSRKLASGFWASRPAPRARFAALQVAERAPNCAGFSYENASGCVVAPNNTEREKRKKDCATLKGMMDVYSRIGREQIDEIGTTGRELNKVGDYYAYGGLAVVTAGSVFDTVYGAYKTAAGAVAEVKRFNDIVDGTPFLIHETRESWKSGYAASVELSTYATEGLKSGAKELAQWASITTLVHDKVNGILHDTINAEMRSLSLNHADTMNKLKNTQKEFKAKGCDEFY